MTLLLLLLSLLYVANAMVPEEISSHEHLVKQLNTLPEDIQHATKKTLKNVPFHDAKFINIDDYGEIYYTDPPIHEFDHDHFIDIIQSVDLNTTSERIPINQLPKY